MDAIRNLVAGADPIGPNPTIPDAKEALHSMFSRPEVFTDRVSPDIPTLAERRQRRSRIVGLMTIAAAAVTAGVLLSLNLGPLTSAPAPANTSTPAPSATSSSVPTATASPAPTPPASQAPPITPSGPPAPAAAAPERYSSQGARLSFDLPAGWTVLEKKVDGTTPSVQLDINNEQGTRVAGLEHALPGGLGGACGPEPVPLLTLDSEAVQIPHRSPAGAGTPEFSFRVLDGTGVGLKVRGSLGLNQPDPQMLESCMYYNTVSSPVATLVFATGVQVTLTDTEGLAFDSVDEAKAYMATQEYAQLKSMFMSLQLVP